MRIYVDGKVVEFPDGTPQEEIEKALVSFRRPDDGTAWMEDYSAANEVGAKEAALIGAGRTVDKFATGVTDLFAGDAEQAQTANEQAQADQAYAQLQDKHPVATTVGEIAGYAPSGMIPGGAAVQVAVGGLTGAAMYNNPEDRTKQGVIDAAISAVPYGAGRLLKKSMGANTGRLASRADDLGWQLTPAEKLNASALRRLEASMESFPPTAGPIRKMKQPRQAAMNRVALEAIGESGDDFADDALLAARARLGEVFDTTIRGNTFEIDNAFLKSLAETEGAAKSGLLGGGNTSKIVDNILDVAAKGDGKVAGDTLQQWRTTLQTAAHKAYRSDTATKEYADALDAMVNSIDDLVERTLPGDDLKAWKLARKQWTAVKKLEKSKAIHESGDVSGRKLANSLMSQDTQGYYRGANKSDLYDAARLSKAYPPMPDSGTASRASIPMMMMTPPAYLAGGNLAARAYANPKAAAHWGAVAGRAATQSEPAPNSPQAFMQAATGGGTAQALSRDNRQRQMLELMNGSLNPTTNLYAQMLNQFRREEEK
ncbi:hypothetical protein [Pseudohalioglobus lutimaris]|uniref:Uncharacterized protein n=1 Tax=Pseudohalioglobus lutimaris TaxID=1737061 RepID=A0A2N5X4P0_9GAMM|nr:hypothetical protein [Pseudohalioglobus lutimaris]PLW69454.1 hypothetical protein C0039_07970 [Pseudohalioglobus lutimaris]